jgi:hypothetical protein
MGNESGSRNQFGELCHIRLTLGQITCAHDGCNAKVHHNCQWRWISLARLPHIDNIPIYCPTHNRQRGDYIAWYYESKKQPIPDSLNITTSKDVGENNQAHISPYIAALLATNPSNVYRSDINPREEPPVRENECSICMTDIDLTNRTTTMLRTHCNHIFHRDCIQMWMKEQVRL